MEILTYRFCIKDCICVAQDEIYIFMEYCPGGTVADAAKQGLPEDMIRKYTKEILVAINFLHEHNIVHRDIKGW